MAECPVDENNLSFSDDEYNSLFITQNSFRDVNTQDVVDAVDYFDTFGNFSSGDSPNVQKQDLDNVLDVQEYDWREHRDVQYFDFTGDHDNGCEVSTQDQGFIVNVAI